MTGARTDALLAIEMVAGYSIPVLGDLADRTARQYLAALKAEADDYHITFGPDLGWRTGLPVLDLDNAVAADSLLYDEPLPPMPPLPGGLSLEVADWVYQVVRKLPEELGLSDDTIALATSVLAYRAAIETPDGDMTAEVLRQRVHAQIETEVTAAWRKRAGVEPEPPDCECSCGAEGGDCDCYLSPGRCRECQPDDLCEETCMCAGHPDDYDEKKGCPLDCRCPGCPFDCHCKGCDPDEHADDDEATMSPSERVNANAHADMQRLRDPAEQQHEPAEQAVVTPPRDLSAVELFEKYAVEAHQHPFTGTRLFYRHGLALAFGRKTAHTLWEWENASPPLLPEPRWWTGNYPVPGEFSWCYTEDEFVGLVKIGLEEGIIRPLRGRGGRKRQPAKSDMGRRAFSLWLDLPAPPEPTRPGDNPAR